MKNAQKVGLLMVIVGVMILGLVLLVTCALAVI